MRLPFKFRKYQSDIMYRGTPILVEHKLLYLAMEVRTGKTLTSLGICEGLCVDCVLFINSFLFGVIFILFFSFFISYNLQ